MADSITMERPSRAVPYPVGFCEIGPYIVEIVELIAGGRRLKKGVRRGKVKTAQKVSGVEEA